MALWYLGGLKGNQFRSFSWLHSTGAPGWSVVTVADLDSNGNPDLIWQNDTTRQVRVSYMGGLRGNEFLSFAWLQSSDTPGWWAMVAK